MAVFLAKMVMPRSRSSSLESMTRSMTVSLARKAPLWRSMASTRVVFPWSTWAMMAILRIVWLTAEDFLLPESDGPGRGLGLQQNQSYHSPELPFHRRSFLDDCGESI